MMSRHNLQISTPLSQINSKEDLPARVVSVMEIDRSAIAHNFNFLRSQLNKAKCSAVVKADAYGIGVIEVADVLYKNGCEDFFVATLDEGIELRQILKDKNVYVLGGLLKGTEDEFLHHNLTPVLNDLGQIKLWGDWAKKNHTTLPAIIHLDTGMWRLGLPPKEVVELSNNLELLNFIHVQYYMSHLACSDSPHHNKNLQQFTMFNQALNMLPQAPVSFANSHAIFLGPQYHYDLVRPGRSLYGLGARFLHTDGIRQALRVSARITQVRDIGKGETVGYDAMYCVPKKTRIATIAVGYADGISRALSNRGHIFIGEHEAPVIGRVSMDMITVDVGRVPEAMTHPGAWVEIIGQRVSADDIALWAGTTSREISSNMGKRYHRIYK